MKSVPLDGEIRDGRHVLTVRVYYEDTDFTGIVYHASYLRFMERGRTNYLRLIGADHRALFEETEKEAPGFAFVVRSMNIEFLKPARMDDVLEVVTEPEEVKGASAHACASVVMRGDELLVEATCESPSSAGGRARPIPKPLRIAMKADQDAAQADVLRARTNRVAGTAPGIYIALVMSELVMNDLGFTFFETAIGRCGIVWSERGVAGVQLPERSEDATRYRVLRRFPAARR